MTTRPLDKNRLQFHGATVVAILVLTVANSASILRPMPGQNSSATKTGPLDTIRGPASTIGAGTIGAGTEASADSKSANTTAAAHSEQMSPNAKLSTKPNSEVDSLMAETRIGCEKNAPVHVPSSTRQIRLVFESCSNGVISVSNETNGFQATLFDQKATDYITLSPATNLLKITRTGVVQSVAIERE